MSIPSSRIIPLNPTPTTVIHHATVESLDANGGCVIEASGAMFNASIAFSCLVRPQPCDRVMYTLDAAGGAYILGILERPGNNNMQLSFPGNTRLENAHGSLSLSSVESINLAAGDTFSCVADQTVCKSRQASFSYQQLQASGQSLQASYHQIKLFSQSITTMARNMISRFQQYIRHSEEADQVSAAQMTREVGGLYSMDSKYTIMVSKKDTKIDGKRIHMG